MTCPTQLWRRQGRSRNITEKSELEVADRGPGEIAREEKVLVLDRYRLLRW
jgi:hypothetical protein